MKRAVWPAVAIVAVVVALATVLLREDGTRESELTGAAKEVAKHVGKRVRLVYAPGGKRRVIEGRVTEVSGETVKIKSAKGKVFRVPRAEIWDVAPAAAEAAPPAEPRVSRRKIESNELSAVAGLRTIAAAQSTWHRNDHDNNAILDFTPTYRNLHYQLDLAGRKVGYIDQALANASGVGGISKSGYRFGDMTAHWQTGPYNFAYEFANCAWPAEYGVTGRHTFVISADGTIFKRDLGLASTLIPIFPNTSAGWTLVH